METHLTRFLGVSSTLTDVELAVALQGVLSRRPAVRSALFSVWQGEASLKCNLSPPEARTRPSASVSFAAPVESQPVEPQPVEPQPVEPQPGNTGGAPPDPITRLVIGARRLAAFHDAKDIGTEHVLAAAARMLPAASSQALGPAWHATLLELLDKSQLSRPKPGGPDGGQLTFKAGVQCLFVAMANAMKAGQSADLVHAALFAAFLALPDNTPAAQLLEMAKIHAQRTEPDAEPERLEKPSAEVCVDLVDKARQFAKHNKSGEVCTEHVLAAAVHLFPQEAAASLGPPLVSQLLALLQKSSLEPPPPNVNGDGIEMEPEADELLAKWAQKGGSAAAMIDVLQAQPDSDSVIQLIEMARVFESRADW